MCTDFNSPSTMYIKCFSIAFFPLRNSHSKFTLKTHTQMPNKNNKHKNMHAKLTVRIIGAGESFPFFLRGVLVVDPENKIKMQLDFLYPVKAHSLYFARHNKTKHVNFICQPNLP